METLASWWKRFVAWWNSLWGRAALPAPVEEPTTGPTIVPEWKVEVCGGILRGHDIGGFIQWMIAEAECAKVVREQGGLTVRTVDWPGERPNLMGWAAYKQKVLGMKRQPGAAPHIYLRRAGHELAHMIEGYTHGITNHRRRWRSYYITLGEDLGILDLEVAEALRAKDASENEIEKAWDDALLAKDMVKDWKVGPLSQFVYCEEKGDGEDEE